MCNEIPKEVNNLDRMKNGRSRNYKPQNKIIEQLRGEISRSLID